MKTINAFALLAAIVLISCTPKPEPVTVDLQAVEDTIAVLAEKYTAAVNARDIEVLNVMMADDGLFCGTDPSEIFDKSALISMYTELQADTSYDLSFQVEKRIIRPAADGKSAIVTEHIRAAAWSPGIMIRQSYQMISTDSGWVIDYASWGFLLRNEDVPRLNLALE